jgi:tryptophan synthase alpha chain
MFKKNSFVPFVTLGDPDFKTSIKIIEELINSGADALELGFAFSDPVADGPVIQKANKRALDNGITNKKNFEILKEIRKKSNISISIMLSYNIALTYGLDEFYKKCRELKIDGILFPDIPLEENKEITKYSKKYKLNQIYLVATNSDKKRIKEITKFARGYIYLVSTLGTTGVRSEIDKAVKTKIKEIKQYSKLPVFVGFGISKPEHVKNVLKMGADGAICGSAICKIIEKNQNDKNLLKKISKFTKSMVKESQANIKKEGTS